VAAIPATLDRRGKPHGPFRRLLRAFIHFFSYHIIFSRRSVRTIPAAGFRLSVPPTVFHPRFFLSSEYFAKFIDRARGPVQTGLRGPDTAGRHASRGQPAVFVLMLPRRA
jgi:hypothetical protein